MTEDIPQGDCRSGRPDTSHEEELRRAGYGCVAGLDEAGRGAWAGPVYAGAVVLPSAPSALRELLGCVHDSKQLTAEARERAFGLIMDYARYAGVGVAQAWEIDELGIARATRLAWMRALEGLPEAEFLLLDAFPLLESSLPQRPLVRGDSRCLSIAAASVVAKVARDRHMREQAAGSPVYGFERNKGYGTRQHQEALSEHGPCSLHRFSFAPIRQLADTGL
ncbi:MAG: ribonuclease HII [Chloroflexota bacterium]|nr:ribonuclease HII [Chloroflexota bacterium]